MRISDWSSDVCSSDLLRLRCQHIAATEQCAASVCACPARQGISWRRACRRHGHRSREVTRSWGRRSAHPRSEEHTSEPQSLMRISYAVFCLKKKNKDRHVNDTHAKLLVTIKNEDLP